jgi:hypothetical protein
MSTYAKMHIMRPSQERLIVHPDLRRVPRIRVVADLLVAVYRSDPTAA